MWEPIRTTGFNARGLPDLAECLDCLRVLLATALVRDHAEEDVRNDLPEPRLDVLRFPMPLVEQRAKIIGHPKCPTFAILRFAHVQANFTPTEIDLLSFPD